MTSDTTGSREFGREDFDRLLVERSNWGRWGADDQVGAINLITPEKRVAAARAVRAGRTISLARDFPKHPSPINPRPAQHFLHRSERNGGGHASDYLGISYHGIDSTHLDALCHAWDERGIYNGRDPDEVITWDGATFGDVAVWGDGIVTRGVVLDVPRFRGAPAVTFEEPVRGAELDELCRANGITIEPGDAVAIYSGREAWERETGRIWATDPSTAEPIERFGADRPGLHFSCLEFLRDHDVAVLAWDMMDMFPYGLGGPPWSVHAGIPAFGMALLDNCHLETLAGASAELDRSDFMLVVAPLKVTGATGSPVNPIAVL